MRYVIAAWLLSTIAVVLVLWRASRHAPELTDDGRLAPPQPEERK